MTELSARVQLAARLVEDAHNGQFRKDGKTPFFTHPYAVMGLAHKYVGTDDETLIAALAHDCVEDVEDFDIDEFLTKVYGDNKVDVDWHKHPKEWVKRTVMALTKNNTISGRHEKDVDSYERIILAGCDTLKLCDRYHNLSDMSGTSPEFQRRYVAETFFMLGFFEKNSNKEIYKELLKLAESKLKEK